MQLQESLTQEARRILQANDRGGFTIPTAGLYPFQWLWDAGFTALGWMQFDEGRAWEEFNWLFQKTARALGIVHLEQQSRI